MEKEIDIHFMASSPMDEKWGITISSVGFQKIKPDRQYPHSDIQLFLGEKYAKYMFSPAQGRRINEYQLIYIVTGCGRLFTFNTKNETKLSTKLKAGDMFLVFPEEWHSYRPDKHIGWTEYWIAFNGDTVEKLLEEGFLSKDSPVFHIGLDDRIFDLFRLAMKTSGEQAFGSQQILGGMVSFLLGTAYSCNERTVLKDSVTAQKINQAKILIAESLESVTPRSLATKLNMSYTNFRRAFRQYVGIAPLSYIHDMKLKLAKSRLAGSMIPLKEIAFDLGFSDYQYFSSLFKKKEQMTPSEYRRRFFGEGK